MNILKKLAGVGVFIVALVSSIVLTRYYMRPAEPAPIQPPAVVTTQMPPAPTASEVPASISVKARLITLDFNARKSYATLVLERDRQQPAPQRVWVRIYFFTADGATSGQFWAGEPVEINQPFAGGVRAAFNAGGVCSWCDEAGAPRRGYYARLYISTTSKDAARPRDEQFDYDIETATPVVVEAASKKSR